MSVDEREREVSWRSHREVTCKTCYGLAMNCYGDDCPRSSMLVYRAKPFHIHHKRRCQNLNGKKMNSDFSWRQLGKKRS